MNRVETKHTYNVSTSHRLIGKIKGSKPGPTVVFFAGIHGNESAGVQALTKVFSNVMEGDITGTMYGIAGNIPALQKGQRYLDKDLNRIWTKERIEALPNKDDRSIEDQEQLNILKILNEILTGHEDPLYFIDFHTTSSKTLPFITINDALINRNFSRYFPVPIVLGIEEYLHGPLLSYINELGYVSLGFESGQHDDHQAVLNSVSFAYLTMVFSGLISKDALPGFTAHYNRLKSESNGLSELFEVVYLYRIKPDESFKMKDGFDSFQDVKKHNIIATSNDLPIRPKYNAKIFMPLYQSKGQEGFFMIKRIPRFIVKLSVYLRRFKADNILALLPGISWANKKKHTLLVDLNTTRFFAKPLFHLLGYRNKQVDETHLKLNNRERASKVEIYKNEWWYKK